MSDPKDLSMVQEPPYPVDADIFRRFHYHAPKGSQPTRYVKLREHGLALAELISESCPPSRERSLAITKLEEVIMWANAGIARRE
jgi:hypothetical protein